MDIRTNTSGLTPGERLDIRLESGIWSLWNGKEQVSAQVEIPKAETLGLNHYKVIVNNDGCTASVVRFADLHRHSDNSLQDGMIKVPDMIKRTEYAGALADHGNMHGFLEFYKGMLAAGKHPILGFEAYQEDLLGNLNGNHLILLAKTTQGYKNLLKLTSESYDHFYRKPHVTWEMLEKYHEGVICTSACLGGIIPTLLKEGKRAAAVGAVERFRAIFGEDFYLEIQRHGIDEEQIVNPQLIALSKELSVPLIATTDSHYLNREDKYAHEVELCLQWKKTMNEPHYTFDGTGYHLHTSAEMEELFSDLPEALDNTLRLAEKCNVTVPLGEVNLPDYQLPAGFHTEHDYFEHLCKEGFQTRFQGTPLLTDPRYIERFDYEMSIITQMKFESYFIIVWDFINYARSNNIYVGPGRGSAAGSLLAYCMGITDMDPIRFNLLFERFLNPERVSWPDIDTDIEHVGRQKVINYIVKKYGAESVCRIATFGTMAAKMVLKDVARVLGYRPGWSNALAKLVPSEPKMTLDKALSMNPELRSRSESDADVAQVMKVSKALEGSKRHVSLHACFEAGTMITTKTGIKSIEMIEPGEFVMTHRGRYQEVVDTIQTTTDSVYAISFYGSHPIRVTGNHPLYARRQYHNHVRKNGSKTEVRTYGAADWVHADSLSKDYYVGIPVNTVEEIPDVSGLPVNSPDFWWIIGRYLGDGWTEIYYRGRTLSDHMERRVIICCEKKDTVELTKITNRLDNCGITYRVEESRTTYKVFLNPTEALYSYLQTFGRYAHGKHLTGDILNLPVSLGKAFLDGYTSADGSCVEATGAYSCKTVSRELAMGLSLMINKVYHRAAGYCFRPAHVDIIEGRLVHSKNQYQLSYMLESKPRQKSFYENGMIWVKVKKIEVETVAQPMYNLTVLNDSSYQANGIAAHNCGVVIAPGQVCKYLPTFMELDTETGEKGLASQVTMSEVEELSLLKMDLLGLKNLTAIHEVIDTIKVTRGINTTYQELPLDDRQTYKMLAKGMTGGVFQLESAGMTNVVTQMLSDINTLPDDRMGECFERLIAAVALYRPGPRDYIPDYLSGMIDRSSVHYDCEQEEAILSSTYGVMVYQEQLMQIAQTLAGYSLGEADLLRKACGLFLAAYPRKRG